MIDKPAPLAQPDIDRAVLAVDQACMLASAETLADSAAGWLQAGAIGLDTEFVRERTYFPRPGLIQVSDGATVWFIDVVALAQPEALGRLLDHRGSTKVLHSVGEDLEIFRILTGTVPDPLFDTQIAAAMLGNPLQCRYEHLVAQVFGVELAGGQARSDWCRRPLSQSLLTYAAQDVIWLPRLCEYLGEQLDRAGRMPWLEEDCARLVERARGESDEPAVLRVKGGGRLTDAGLSVLARLAEWRDGQARARDLPRSFVIKDEQLIALAEAHARPDQLGQTLNQLPPAIRRRYAETLEALITQGPDPAFARPPEFQQLDPESREQIRSLQDAVGKIAKELAIEPALIASKRELTRLVRGQHPDWLSGWRGQLLAPALAEVLGT